MKLLVKINYSDFLAIEATNAGPLVECLAKAQLVKQSQSAGTIKYEPTATVDNAEPGTLEIMFVPDSAFIKAPEPLEKIEKERRQAESRWLDYYNKFNASEAKCKELQAKLDSIQKATV